MFKEEELQERNSLLIILERQKIRLLRLIPNHDYASSLRQAQALHCEGTCHWLLENFEVGWIRQIQSISGAMEFVSLRIIDRDLRFQKSY